MYIKIEATGHCYKCGKEGKAIDYLEEKEKTKIENFILKTENSKSLLCEDCRQKELERIKAEAEKEKERLEREFKSYKFEKGLTYKILHAKSNGVAGYVQVNFDRETKEVWGDYHYSLGCNSWTEYHDLDIINIGNFSGKWTLREIFDEIQNELDERKARRAWRREYLKQFED
jgi:hypothetical protein